MRATNKYIQILYALYNQKKNQDKSLIIKYLLAVSGSAYRGALPRLNGIAA